MEKLAQIMTQSIYMYPAWSQEIVFIIVMKDLFYYLTNSKPVVFARCFHYVNHIIINHKAFMIVVMTTSPTLSRHFGVILRDVYRVNQYCVA